MESFLKLIEQTQSFIRIVIALLILGIIIFTINMMRKAYKPNFDKNKMPANLWFYSQLINLEVGNVRANYKNLYDSFVEFLHKKYHIKKEDLKKNTIFEIVNAREENLEILNFYGDIWNSIDEMKKSKPDTVILYTKSIKSAFNKEDITEWLEIQKNKKPCNDC